MRLLVLSLAVSLNVGSSLAFSLSPSALSGRSYGISSTSGQRSSMLRPSVLRTSMVAIPDKDLKIGHGMVPCQIGSSENADKLVEEVMAGVIQRNNDEPEFQAAVGEFLQTLKPLLEMHPEYADDGLLQRLVEPERSISFRVPWKDDYGQVRVNRGYRIQFSSAIGPYMGGLRFHPAVNLSTLKMLGFLQMFKNSLTGLPLGAGFGGSDFDPRGKSDDEVMAFCQSYMQELFRHIGHNSDIPTLGAGVGAREIGYLYGMYKKLRNEFTGTLAGKNPTYGGSVIRPESTGFGLLYFLREMLQHNGQDLVGKKIVVSGSGTVAQFAAEKAIQMGAVVVAMSDSSGYIHDPSGISKDKLSYIKQLKGVRQGRIAEYAHVFPGATYHPVETGSRIWSLDADIALPCAREGEITSEDAALLIENGCMAVGEGANHPCTLDAIQAFRDAGVFFAPGNAANAGGVATSSLEMSQNSQGMSWDGDKVNKKMEEIMVNIHDNTARAAAMYGCQGDYYFGANVAAFLKIADAMKGQGIC